LRELKRRLNTTPTQITIRDALADDLLECTNAFRLDLLAFGLPPLALDAKRIIPAALSVSIN
jgi:hypothetical protein